MQAFIVKIRVSSLEGSIAGGKVCLAMFLTLDKQFLGQFSGFLQINIGVPTRQTWNGSGSGSLYQRRDKNLKNGDGGDGSIAIIGKQSASIVAGT